MSEGSESAAVAVPRSSWRRTVLGLVVGVTVAVLAMKFLGISRQQLTAALRAARPWPLAFVACGSFGLLAFQALRWWLVMRPVVRLRYRDAFTALTVAFLFNNAIPGRGGDLLRVQWLGRRTGTSRVKLLGTELVDVLSDKWGWIAAFPLLCLIQPPPRWLLHALAILAAVAVGGSVVMVAVARSAWGRGSSGPAWLRNVRDAFSAQRWKRLVLIEGLIAPLPWLWETLLIVVGTSTLGMSVSPMEAFATLTAFNLAIALPNAPGNMGTFEAGGAMALVGFGFARADAMAVMLLYHLALVLPLMALGVVLLAVNGGFANLKPRGAGGWGVSTGARP